MLSWGVQLLQGGVDITDTVVQVGQHGCKDSSLNILDLAELVHITIGSLHWTVNGIV